MNHTPPMDALDADALIRPAKPGRFTSSVYAVATWSLWLILTAALVWAANKGIAMTDEGALLLGYKHPEQTIYSTTFFTLIVSQLFGWLHPGVVAYRLLNLLIGGGAVAVFTLGLSAWLKDNVPLGATPWVRVRFLFPFVAIGNLFGYAFFGQTLSYNSLNDDLLLISYGLLLSMFVQARRPTIWIGATYILVGILTGIQFFIKFSSSILFACACVVAVLLLSRSSRVRTRIYGIMLFGAGAALGLALFFRLCLDFTTWRAGFFASVASLSGASHDPHVLLAGTEKGLALMAVVFVFQAIVSAILCLLIHRRRDEYSQSHSTRLAAYLIAGFAFMELAGFALLETLQKDTQGDLGGYGTILGPMLVLAFGSGALLAHGIATKMRLLALARRYRGSIGVAVLLALAPIIGATGSNVQILAAAGQYMAFWFGLIATILVIASVWHSQMELRLAPILWSVPLLLVVALTAQGVVLHPVGVRGSLFAQTQVLARTGDLANLAVDKDTERFFQEAQHLIASDPHYRTSDPIISAYDLPGLIYVLGGVSPGAPWFFADEPQQERNCAELRSTRRMNLNRSIVLVMTAIQPAFARCLRTVGIGFPGRYHLMGVVKSSYSGDLVKIFAPL